MGKMSRGWIVAAAAALAACGGPQARVVDGRVQGIIDQAPERRAYFESIGIGASDPALPTETQRRALARDAAIVKAQYELLSMLKGVTLDGGVSVQRALEADSKLEARLRATIRRAQVIKSEFTEDHGCVVTMRLPKDQLVAALRP
jgi:hypothetical protein